MSDLSIEIGRDDEFAMLLRRWQASVDGEGHVIMLSGEPGIGKSRTTEALREYVEAGEHMYLSVYQRRDEAAV